MQIKMLFHNFVILFTIILFTIPVQSQNIAGKIIDAGTKEGLIGATIQVEGINVATTTDLDGRFFLTVDNFPAKLIINYVGYTTQMLNVTSATQELTIKMSANLLLDAIVVTGSRGKPRTVLTSPVPIDNINIAQLKVSGQASLDQMINLIVPSFNSTPQTISDASAHFDPSELRNLGPLRIKKLRPLQNINTYQWKTKKSKFSSLSE